LFTIMVLMAIVTTAATAPLLDRLTRDAPDLTTPATASEPATARNGTPGAAR
jgi:hypothetical protein